jgi:DNA-directed RNA polymerase subunit L
MIVKVLDLEKDKVRLIIQGEGHTFMNALVEEILSDPDVDVAKYMIESPSYYQKGMQTDFGSLQRAHQGFKETIIL